MFLIFEREGKLQDDGITLKVSDLLYTKIVQTLQAVATGLPFYYNGCR